jgi:hypothetical protein
LARRSLGRADFPVWANWHGKTSLALSMARAVAGMEPVFVHVVDVGGQSDPVFVPLHTEIEERSGVSTVSQWRKAVVRQTMVQISANDREAGGTDDDN